MNKRNILTKEQKEYIINNYPKEQTKKIADFLGLSMRQVNGYANQNGIKKQEGFIVIRSDNSLTIEEQDFIFDNYANMENKEIINKLNISNNLLLAFARQHNLKKKNKLLSDKSKIPLEKRKYILDNYATMLTKEISKNIGIDENTIRSYAYSHGVRRNRDLVIPMCENKNGLTNYQKQFIIDNYSIMKNEDIAEKLGITSEQIHNYAKNKKFKKNFDVLIKRDNYFNICLTERENKNYNVYNFLGKDLEPKIEEDNLYKSKYGKYFLNQNYFENIDNEWKAYWLGFLYADGYVINRDKNNKKQNIVGLGLKQEDKSHIKKFANSIQSNSPIKDYKTNYKDNCASKIMICNKKFCNDLVKNGCIENKTFLLRFPELREDLIRHFIRGYFDGDGCISININKKIVRVNIVGTYDILKTICYIFNKEFNANIPKFQTKNKYSENEKVYSIQWGNVYTCKKIYQYLYKDCNIYLDRKLKKFDTIYCLE